ncbi:MAG: hypothetical protein ABFE01_12250, partial [Phycisphaerales bacterium]
MAKQRGLRGFTRVDALVAGAACLVLALFVSALHAMTREHYFRTVCAAHLGDIGKTMFVYAADNETVLPRAGGPLMMWGRTADWAASDRRTAYGIASDVSLGRATISSCFYLLVKYYQAQPGLFVCPGDEGTTAFSLADVANLAGISAGFDLADAWDFGPSTTSYKSCSFAYHFPFAAHNLTTSRDANLAVAADRNPWLTSPAGAASTFAEFQPDISPYAGDADTARVGNSASHLR